MKERPEAGGRNTWSRTSNRGRPVEPPDRREEATSEGDRHLSHVSPVEPTTGRATPTPTREESHLTVHRTRHARHTMHRSGSRRTTSSSRHRSRSTNSDSPAAEVDGHKRTQTQQPAQPYTKNMTAPPAAVDGHTAPPDPAAEAVIPAMPPIATGKRILTGSKTPGKTLQIRRKRGENRPSCKRRDSSRRFRNHRRPRGKRLNTLLGFTSGQPSWLHRSQAGRSQVSPA